MEIEAVSINGQIYSNDEAKISALDRGLMFAHGAFETFRISDGSIFLYDEHITRLDKNLKALDIDWAYDREEHQAWIKGISSTIPPGKDGRIRFCVTSGIDGGHPNVIIYLSLIDKFKPTEKKAQFLGSVKRHKPEYFEATGFRIKSLEYSYIYMAKKELKNLSDEGILLNPDGYVAEALTSNIFWTKDSVIQTPPLNLGILAGTMRSWLMNNFKVEEKLAKMNELLDADEIFLTAGASYLTAINNIENTSKPGVTGQVYKSIYDILASDLGKKSVKL